MSTPPKSVRIAAYALHVAGFLSYLSGVLALAATIAFFFVSSLFLLPRFVGGFLPDMALPAYFSFATVGAAFVTGFLMKRTARRIKDGGCPEWWAAGVAALAIYVARVVSAATSGNAGIGIVVGLAFVAALAGLLSRPARAYCLFIIGTDGTKTRLPWSLASFRTAAILLILPVILFAWSSVQESLALQAIADSSAQRSQEQALARLEAARKDEADMRAKRARFADAAETLGAVLEGLAAALRDDPSQDGDVWDAPVNELDIRCPDGNVTRIPTLRVSFPRRSADRSSEVSAYLASTGFVLAGPQNNPWMVRYGSGALACSIETDGAACGPLSNCLVPEENPISAAFRRTASGSVVSTGGTGASIMPAGSASGVADSRAAARRRRLAPPAASGSTVGIATVTGSVR